MTREQMLFIITIFISILLVRYEFSFFPADELPQTTINSFDSNHQIFSDEKTVNIVFQKNDRRQLFEKNNDRRSLSTLSLTMPEIFFPYRQLLLPYPAPYRYFWQNVADQKHDMDKWQIDNFTEDDIFTSLKKNETKSLSAMAQKIKNAIQDNDVVILRNGRKYQGTILEKKEGRIVMHVSVKGSGSTYKWELDKIKEIKPAQDLRSIYRKYRLEFGSDKNRLVKLAMAIGELEDHDLAQELFEYVLQVAPKFDYGYQAYAQYLTEILQYEKAYRVYVTAEKSGRNAEVLIAKARLEKKLALDNVALTTLSKIEHEQAVLLILEITFDSKPKIFDNNLAILQKMTERKKSLLPALAFWQAKKALAQGNAVKCLEFSHNALGYRENERKNIEGVSLYLQKKYSQAAGLFFQAGKEGDIAGWYNLAFLFFLNGEKQKAIQILETISQVEFTSESNALLLLSYIYSFSTEQNKALELLEYAEKENPRDFSFYYFSAAIKEKQGEIQKSLEYYSQALNKDFSCHYLFYKLIYLSIKEKNYSEAFYYLRQLETDRSILRERDLSYFYYLLAYLHARQQQFDSAQNYLQKSLALAGQDAPALLLHAWILNARGQSEKALEIFRSVTSESEKNYAESMAKKIEKNRDRVLWLDDFNRFSGSSVRKGWTEIESISKNNIVLKSRRVFFFGGKDYQKAVVLKRALELKSFVSFSIDLVSISSAAKMGIFIGDSRGQKLYFGCNEDNFLQYSIATQCDNNLWQKILDDAVWQGKHSLKIERVEKNSYRLLLDDKPLLSKISLPRISGHLECGVFGSGKTEWKFTVDNAKIIENKR